MTKQNIILFFSNAPSWNNPIQSNLESCISETTVIQLYLNVWYGIASLHGMAHYHMVLYGTVPLVLHGNNCTLSATNFIQPDAPNIFLNDGAIFFTLLFFVSFIEKSKRTKIPQDINLEFFRGDVLIGYRQRSSI